MPTKHIDAETWSMIEDLQENICQSNDFATKTRVLKQVLKRGIEAIVAEQNMEKSPTMGKSNGIT